MLLQGPCCRSEAHSIGHRHPLIEACHEVAEERIARARGIDRRHLMRVDMGDLAPRDKIRTVCATCHEHTLHRQICHIDT